MKKSEFYYWGIIVFIFLCHSCSAQNYKVHSPRSFDSTYVRDTTAKFNDDKYRQWEAEKKKKELRKKELTLDYYYPNYRVNLIKINS